MPRKRKAWESRIDGHPSRPESRTEERSRESGISAWILEWRPLDETQVDKRRVVAVLSPRWSAERVAEIGKALFAVQMFEPGEMRSLLLKARKTLAELERVAPRWRRLKQVDNLGEVTFPPDRSRFELGCDPYILGRKVANLREPVLGRLVWDEVPGPDTIVLK